RFGHHLTTDGVSVFVTVLYFGEEEETTAKRKAPAAAKNEEDDRGVRAASVALPVARRVTDELKKDTPLKKGLTLEAFKGRVFGGDLGKREIAHLTGDSPYHHVRKRKSSVC